MGRSSVEEVSAASQRHTGAVAVCVGTDLQRAAQLCGRLMRLSAYDNPRFSL